MTGVSGGGQPSAVGVLIVTRNPRAAVPMGPDLIAGAIVGLAWGPAVFPALA